MDPNNVGEPYQLKYSIFRIGGVKRGDEVQKYLDEIERLEVFAERAADAVGFLN